MLFETPDDIYNSYKKFLKKEDFKRAYHCLERLLHEFPDDMELMKDMVNLCLSSWNRLELGRKWLRKLTRLRTYWFDCAFLSNIEAELGDIERAKKYLRKARELQKSQPSPESMENPKRILSDLERFIKYRERDLALTEKLKDSESELSSFPKTLLDGRRKATKDEKTISSDDKKTPSTLKTQKAEETQQRKVKDLKVPHPAPKVEVPLYTVPVRVESPKEGIFSPFIEGNVSPLKDCQLLIDYTYLTIQRGFDELLCINEIKGVDRYWYQIETVKKVLKSFLGRVLLCDEVGLGKTIEAGMLIKEYLMRGMVKNVLILVPPSLVSQWKEEMETKFGIGFATTDGIEFTRDPKNFWKETFIIASISTAKSTKNMATVIEQFYDLVVVDEAHHLRNRTTLAWKLVNQIKKRFIFLLTATPVQNNLIELFNLITLLKPGQFKTEKLFKKEYIQKDNLRAPANKERLREVLRDVMVRNTRSAIDLKLPKRFATTMRIKPTETERDIYLRLNDWLKRHDLKRPILHLLLREAGSSPFALKASLINMDSKEIKGIIDAIDGLGDTSKGKALLDILLKNPDEKKVVFVQYVKSMDYITALLGRHRIPYTTFRGDISFSEKDEAIARFKSEVPVLVSTESGGEGRNLQFCNTIINFDLPWNPMRIEQRIGRLHRIGQTRDVFIFNLSMRGTIEDYIIEILDNKINMFEMVIGEIEPILGYIGVDREFQDVIMEIWLKSSGQEELKMGFEELGRELVDAKMEYMKAKSLDDEIFGEDYGI